MLQRRNAMLTTILTGETAEDETDGDDVSRDNVSRDDLSRESDALSIVNIEALIAEQIQGVAQIDFEQDNSVERIS